MYNHPSPADVDPLGEGLSARRCRQRASERDKSHRFHDDVFHGCSPFAFNSLAPCPATSKITPSHFLLGEAQKQINCEAADPEFGGGSFGRFGSKAVRFRPSKCFPVCPSKQTEGVYVIYKAIDEPVDNINTRRISGHAN